MEVIPFQENIRIRKIFSEIEDYVNLKSGRIPCHLKKRDKCIQRFFENPYEGQGIFRSIAIRNISQI